MPAPQSPMLRRPAIAKHDAGPGNDQRQPPVAVHGQQSGLAFGLGPGIDVSLRKIAKLCRLGDHLCRVGHVIGRNRSRIDQPTDLGGFCGLGHAHGGANVIFQRGGQEDLSVDLARL